VRASLRLNNDLAPDQLVSLATLAESHGFDSIWVSHDLFLRPSPVLLALLARETSRIGIGSCVLNPYSAHPAELAMTAATLQEVSGGHFRLGIAAGDAGFLGWAGLQRRRPLERVGETVVAVRALLAGKRPAEVSGAGEGWGADAWLRTGPAPTPIYLGAMGPRMLRLAGAVADGALALLFPPEHYPVAAGLVLEGAAAAGRDPSELDRPACVWCSIDPDPGAGAPGAGRQARLLRPGHLAVPAGAGRIAAPRFRAGDCGAARRRGRRGRPPGHPGHAGSRHRRRSRRGAGPLPMAPRAGCHPRVLRPATRPRPAGRRGNPRPARSCRGSTPDACRGVLGMEGWDNDHPGRRGVTRREEGGMSMLDRLLRRLLARPVGDLIRQALDEELYRYRLHGDPGRLHVDPTAVINNALFNVSAGEITVGPYAFFGHNVSVLTGNHDINKFGRERQTAIQRSGRDVVVGEGAWLASHVLVLGPCRIGEHAVVAAGSLVTRDVAPYTVVAGRPATLVRRIEQRQAGA
jgi:alkanesulfonate monooxygenase SsuD/methylene tetrahydromethanopterin reductase-like flavin-dependent oxidoreductase (luciferase family)/acetyltransferase-like isoleucine patch superfamily enzyme